VPSLKHVWQISEGDVAMLESAGEKHLQENPALYECTWPAALPEDVATIIYTSGTTGEPKGVMLTHRNIVADIEAVIRITPHLGPEDLFLSFLPLAHVYERTAGQYFPLRLGAGIAYCESLFTVDKNLAEVKPTVMTCVPRLYESSREKLFSAANALPEDKRGKYLDALQLAIKAGLARAEAPGAVPLSLVEKFKYKMYDGAVYSKIREKFGGRLKHFVSGGAPMSPELGALFIGIGLEVLEGYGLTETSPVITVNRPGHPRLATVGPPLPGVKVKIAEDGEILVQGDTVMKGYWNKPAETAAVLTPDGWFHTGDIGHLDNGLLRITDRKKDLLVLANGKKVAPAPIEIRLQDSRYISQAVLLGDKLKSVTALIIPNFPALREWAAKENLGVTQDAELLKLPAVNQLIKREIELQTNDLADFERIRKFVLLAEALTPQAGELTPTLKVKRKVVAEKYGHLVEA
jgi:long-chain acyl-CoA synthetase